MKIYTDFDKKVIRYLIKNIKYPALSHIGNLLNPYLDNAHIEIDCYKCNVKLQVKCKLSKQDVDRAIWASWASEKISNLENVILSLVNILQYLEKNGLIIIYTRAKQAKSIVQYGKKLGNNWLNFDFPDKRVIDLLIQYAGKNIIATNELITLEGNKFISTDEIRFKKQYCNTIIAIILSFIIGIMSIVFNIISSNQASRQIKVNNRRYNNLQDRINMVDSLISLDKLKIIELKKQNNKLSKILETIKKTNKEEEK
ncbi:MAG: hypothetical protein HQ534_01520 [Armatimonadetes bacterium]|nr:hypothetical protein [Armatimonadota bacterium]